MVRYQNANGAALAALVVLMLLASGIVRAQTSAIDRGQIERWRFSPPPVTPHPGQWDPANPPPAERMVATEDKVYVQSSFEVVYALDGKTGEILERYDDARLVPEVEEGVFYVYYDTDLHALDARSGRELWSYDFNFIFDLDEIETGDGQIYITGSIKLFDFINLYGRKIFAIAADSGQLRWSEAWQSTGLTGLDGMVGALFARTFEMGWSHQILSFYASDSGELLWAYGISRPYPAEDSSAFLRLASSPRPLTASAEAVYVATNIEEEMGGNRHVLVGGVVFALARKTGEVLRKYEMEGTYINLATNRRGDVYVDAESSTIALDGRTGERLWGGAFGTNLIAGEVIYGQSYEKGEFVAVNARSGERLWRLENENGFYSVSPGDHMIVAAGVLYAASRDGILHAIDAATGKVVWTCEMGGKLLPSALVNGTLYVRTGGGGIAALDIRAVSF